MSIYNGLIGLDVFENKNINVFIGSLSFEDRCLSSFKCVDFKKFDLVVFFINESYSDFYGKNKSELLRLKDKISFIEIDQGNQILIASELKELASSLLNLPVPLGKLKIIVDITTFTRDVLLILVKVFSVKLQGIGKIYWVYNSVERMSQKWLSKSVVDVKSVLGYSGFIRPSRNLHLVVLSGFEPERAREIINIYEPDIISIGCGSNKDSLREDLFKKNEELFKKLIGYYGSQSVRKFEFGLSSPQNTRTSLTKYLEDQDFFGMNTVIAPLNNKISTIGVAMYTFGKPDVQVCYARVAEYNTKDYSIPSNTFYVFEGFAFKEV